MGPLEASHEEYAAACKAELGLPMGITLPPMNCLDGVEIPVTVDGVRPDAETYAALMAGEVGCDNPSWIGDGEPCANYSFILHHQLSESVDAVLFCRQRAFTNHLNHAERLAAFEETPSRENFESLYNFDTFGMIWTSRETGATCFFDLNRTVYGGHVVMPDDPTPPRLEDLPEPRPPEGIDATAWELNNIGRWNWPLLTAGRATCTTCHDAGPFVRSGHSYGLNAIPPHQNDTPYFMAGTVGQALQMRHPPSAVSTTPIQGPDGEEGQVCTTCHRIGGNWGCGTFTRYYTGVIDPPGQEASLPFEERVLMPPMDALHGSLSNDEAQSLWSERYAAHVDKLLCCCDNPNAIGCTLQDITQSPLPTPVSGQGPESCEL